MNVGGNKGRNGGRKEERKEQREEGWEEKWGRKEEKATGKKTGSKSLASCLYCFLLHESHKSTMSLTDTHFSEHTHDIVYGTRLASGLAVFLCYGKAALGPLSVGT